MDILLYSLKILIYCVIGLLIYKAYIFRLVRQKISAEKNTISSKNKDANITLMSALLLSALFGWYSTIVTSKTLSADRLNYSIRFVQYRKDPWTTGLNKVAEFLHLFTNNPDWLFFSVAFITLFVLLLAYNFSEARKKEVLLMIVCSDLLVFCFPCLKQGPSNAFAACCLVLLIEKKLLGMVLCLICAVMFHETSIIVLPIILMCILSKIKIFKWLSYLLMILSLLFFGILSRTTMTYLSQMIPDLYEESSSYLDSSGAIAQKINYLTALKGMPFYLITIQGIRKSKQLKNCILQYDTYMIMSIFCSMMVLLASYSYWMRRFSLYFYVPVFIFASELYKKDNNRNNAQIFFYAVVGSLAFFTLRYLGLIFFKYGGF